MNFKEIVKIITKVSSISIVVINAIIDLSTKVMDVLC